MKKIGIVGLGIMGSGIADNFLIGGHPLFVWNRTMDVARKFVSRGAVACQSPAEVAKKAEIIFEVTANDESSRMVWDGREGILAAADPTKILIASSTLSIDWTDELIKKCNALGFAFMDAAMTGGRIGAETGALTLLCGAQKNVFDAVDPDLKAIAKKTILFGPPGQGMRYKLILNFLQAVHIVGFGQAMKIAKSHNMDLNKVGDALVDRPGGTITTLAWRDYFNEPDPINFSIEWITKDLNYAKKLANDLDVGLLDEVLEKYKKAVENGMSKNDWASINKSL